MVCYKRPETVDDPAQPGRKNEHLYEQVQHGEEWIRREAVMELHAENTRLLEQIDSLEVALVELNGPDWWKELEGPDPRWSDDLGKVV